MNPPFATRARTRSTALLAAAFAAAMFLAHPAGATAATDWGSAQVVAGVDSGPVTSTSNYPALGPAMAVSPLGPVTIVTPACSPYQGPSGTCFDTLPGSSGDTYDTGLALFAHTRSNGSWQSQQELGHLGSGHPDRIFALAVGASGDAVALWHACADSGGNGCALLASERPAGSSTWSAQKVISTEDNIEPAVTVDSHGNAWVAWSAYSGSWEFHARSLSSDGTLGSDQTITADMYNGEFALAGDPSGHAVLAYTNNNDDVMATTVATATGTWSAPQTLEANADIGGTDHRPFAGIGPDGEATVGWWYRFNDATNPDGADGIYTRSQDSLGAWQSRRLVPSSTDTVAGTVSMARDGAGDLVLAWVGNGQGATDYQTTFVRVARLAAGGSAWSTDTADSWTGSEPPAAASIAMNDEGDAALTYPYEDSGSTWGVRATVAPAGKPFGSPTLLGAAVTMTAGIDSHGIATVSFTGGDQYGDPGIMAASTTTPLDGSGGGDGTPVPVNQSAPTISGDALVGSSLSVTHGSWTNSPTGYDEQWERCKSTCNPVGSNSSHYDLTSADAGYTIAVAETARNGGGPATTPALSAPTSTVTDPSAGSGGTGSGGAPGQRYTGGGSFQPAVSPSLTGYTDPGEPAYPTFPTGSSIPQGLLSDRQEIFRGSVLAATPLCSDGTDDIALCELQVDGPVNTPEDKITPLAAGAQRLPTDRNGEYDVIIYAQSKSGQGYNPGVWRYEVGDPPSQSQTLSSLLGSTASFPVLINKGPLFSLSDSNCPRAGTLPVGCFRTLDDPSGKPLVIIGGDGSIIAAGGGNIIAAGGGNLTRDAINQIIAAGGGNVVAAGGGNVARILDADGNVIGIIAAGGGNLAIIAAGGGNVIGAGGGNIIADAAGHIVSAGGGNIIAAGGGNIIAAGGGNIIAAGGGNITVAGADLGKMTGQNGFSFAAAFTGVAAAISGPLGSDQFTLSTTGVGSGGYQFRKLGSTGLTAAEAHKKHHRLTTISSGAVTITRKGGKATLLLRLTPAGRKLVAALAKRNATAARHHRHLAQLTVVLTETNRSSYGRTVTATRKFKVTPRMAHKPAPRH